MILQADGRMSDRLRPFVPNDNIVFHVSPSERYISEKMYRYMTSVIHFIFTIIVALLSHQGLFLSERQLARMGKRRGKFKSPFTLYNCVITYTNRYIVTELLVAFPSGPVRPHPCHMLLLEKGDVGLYCIYLYNTRNRGLVGLLYTPPPKLEDLRVW